ncbi:hypothetical protein [uncultured Dechloromonas sp.]|uniref:hypothetical protein n=1 Tax=uncultured Dechloromonas sp. TaxID=171719 RepID=UPI0025E07899|nr:hypothetical protein [uncultured Dechloromonas sp.]
MALLDVVPVFVVQDRESGAFIDINMTFVSSLRHAARSANRTVAHESMNCAILDGLLSCPDGYEVHMFYEEVN